MPDLERVCGIGSQPGDDSLVVGFFVFCPRRAEHRVDDGQAESVQSVIECGIAGGDLDIAAGEQVNQ